MFLFEIQFFSKHNNLSLTWAKQEYTDTLLTINKTNNIFELHIKMKIRDI